MTRDLGFKRISYGLFMFADFAEILDQSNLSFDQLNQPTYNSFVFIPNLSFFFLGFNVDHSKLMKLSFCHVLLWFANITNSKSNIYIYIYIWTKLANALFGQTKWASALFGQINWAFALLPKLIREMPFF